MRSRTQQHSGAAPGATARQPDEMAVLRMQLKDSLAPTVLLTCVLCFPLHTHAGDASVQSPSLQLRAVEKKLREYLHKRVLVFRKGEISRHQIRFDPKGQPVIESGSELTPRPNAILFTGLILDPEHLVILGEAARVRPRTSQPILLRHSREFKLVTCTIILDVPPDELTFAHMIVILCRVFLTGEEFEKAAFQLRDYELSDLPLGTLR